MNPLTSILDTTAERIRYQFRIPEVEGIVSAVRAEQLRLLEAVKEKAQGMKYETVAYGEVAKGAYNLALSDIIAALTLNEKDV